VPKVSEIMQCVFVLQHLHILPDGEEDVKLIGVYRSLIAARAAVDRLRSKPGFCDYPRIVDPITDEDKQGFYIDEYPLDKDHWPEGYVTV
jgi:hypothetical protein